MASGYASATLLNPNGSEKEVFPLSLASSGGIRTLYRGLGKSMPPLVRGKEGKVQVERHEGPGR